MSQNIPEKQTISIVVNGIVQGVGFRPFVWQLAKDMGLNGEVLNNNQGVQIVLNVNAAEQNTFLNRLEAEAPPLANITNIQTENLSVPKYFKNFRICPSKSLPADRMSTQISPDATTCPACIEEVFNSAERRYKYPFTNCTHCGPRLSIIYEAPYDRKTTSMAAFEMCTECQTEYDDPADRRFHAQPIACPKCGPALKLILLKEEEAEQSIDLTEDPIQVAAKLIKAGKIGAVKGLGGFHLTCLATDEVLVKELRSRKKRSNKAFALMCKDQVQAQKYGEFSKEELELLECAAAPIVLVNKGKEALPAAIAPALHQLGIMLPNTPLHHLLLSYFDEPLIMTSGNISNMPQLISNDEVCSALNNIADFALIHDRRITNRVDDSVVRITNDQPAMLRRARGYAPASIPLPKGFEDAPDLIACGAELKSTFCMIKDKAAILSQHLGDLEHVPTYEAYEQTIALYTDLFDHQPIARVIDEHPEYLSSKYGQTQSEKDGLQLVRVQHHHAHMASAMGENDHGMDEGNCLGLILDGIGFGTDETIWGGELLYGDYRSVTRIGAFPSIALPGSASAVKEPWRNLYAHIEQSIGWEMAMEKYQSLPLMDYMKTKPLPTLEAMMRKGLNSPLSSSCGRLFDAVAASLELSADSVTYEGEAAMQLEALVSKPLFEELEVESLYKAQMNSENQMLKLDFSPLWQGLLNDLAIEKTKTYIATKFHKSLTYILLDWIMSSLHNLENQTEELSKGRPTKIALSGGCFQNNTLSEALIPLLEQNELRPLFQSKVPANDGGISYGQALIAAAHLSVEERK